MSDFSFDISGAQSSQTYNPTVDSGTSAIYGVVSTSSVTDEVYAQYQSIFDNLPTANAYSAAIQNPNKGYICDSQDSISSMLGSNATTTGSIGYNNSDTGSLGLKYYHISLAGTAVPNASGETGTNPSTAYTYDGDISVPDQNGVYPGNTGYQPTQQQQDTKTTWDQTYPSMVSSIQNANSGISDFENHTDKLIANLPMILGIVQSALGLANILGNLANPCLGISNMLGSITSKGKALMAKIRNAIQEIEDAIGSAIAYVEKIINKAIAKVMAFVNKLKNLIEDEIKSLIKAMIDGLHFGLSGLLNALKLDPCMKSLLGMLGTGSLLSVL